MPFYYVTSISTRRDRPATDSVQHLHREGADSRFGLWDGNAPRTTHQELAARVVWKDTKTLIPTSTRRTSPGTMIALGASGRRRKGMANEASISALPMGR